MRILLLALNYAPDEIGIARYTTEMCESLTAMGHDVHVVTAPPYYPAWKVPASFPKRWHRERVRDVTVTRCPIYVPANPTGLRRILHHISFAASSLLPLLRAARAVRPDVIMTIAPSLIAAPAALIAARLVRCPTWLHVQDFEVEAAVATDLVDAKSRTLRLARWFERLVLQRFSRVSTISEEMCVKLKALGVVENQITEFRNWADVETIRPDMAGGGYRRLWNIDEPYIALYSGNIANKQGIEVVIDAARLLSGRKDLRFVICGSGPNRTRLEQDVDGLPNVSVRDLQPVEKLGDLLGLATVHLLPQRADAADLVLPSKLTNMLASGRPVIATAAPGTGLAREIEGCGIVVPPGDADALASAIEAMIDDRERCRLLGAAARDCAERRWSKDAIIAAAESRMRALATDPGRAAMPQPETVA